ncbi:hypothetical protein O9929_14195 [Vibrio lentus]|nr:hypothetical protein [Vibrio lentus]
MAAYIGHLKVRNLGFSSRSKPSIAEPKGFNSLGSISPFLIAIGYASIDQTVADEDGWRDLPRATAYALYQQKFDDHFLDDKYCDLLFIPTAARGCSKDS